MEAKGFLSLPEFLKQKSEKAKQQGSIEVEAEAQAAAAEVVVEGIEEASEASERASTPPPASTEPESVSAAFMVAEMALVLLEVLGVSTAAAKPAMKEEEEVSNTRSEKTSTHTPSDSSSDLSDIRQSSWGPSRTILYNSSKELTLSCDSNSQNNPEDLRGTNTWELEGLHHRDAPDDDATQQAMDSTTKLLQDCAELQVVQRELSFMVQQKSLNAVLHGHVVAMVG